MKHVRTPESDGLASPADLPMTLGSYLAFRVPSSTEWGGWRINSTYLIGSFRGSNEMMRAPVNCPVSVTAVFRHCSSERVVSLMKTLR